MNLTPDRADADLILSRRLSGWRPDHVGTLLFVRRAREVLLIRKKRGHGAGLINGPGGKLEPGETPLAGALRETREEVGISVLDATRLGRFKFVEQNGPQWLAHVFGATRFDGEPTETAEAEPAWFPTNDLPFQQMWPDDRFWLPRVLAGERLEGAFLFDAGVLLSHRLSPWKSCG